MAYCENIVSPPVIIQVDLADDLHHNGILDLLNMYACEPLQGGRPLDETAQRRLIPGLAAQSNGRYFLALDGTRPVGLAICFLGYSTFRALPLLNVHDLTVHRDYRGQGLGTKLLAAVEQEAIRLGCCKLTLEVHSENVNAQRLYERVGFGCGSPTGADAAFMTKTLV